MVPLMSDYRAMLEGLSRVQVAGMLAAGAVAARGVRLALRQGEATAAAMLHVLRQPASQRQDGWEGALREIQDGQADCLRELVGLPRIGFMLFLGELHRLRMEAIEEEKGPPDG